MKISYIPPHYLPSLKLPILMVEHLSQLGVMWGVLIVLPQPHGCPPPEEVVSPGIISTPRVRKTSLSVDLE